MKCKIMAVVVLFLVASDRPILAEGGEPPSGDPGLAALVGQLKPQHGDITLGSGLATLKVPEEFGYLDPQQAKTMLEKIWGNPHGEGTLGMLIPSGVDVLSADCWGVVITYEEEGYVKDDDADKIDYTDLMKTMKEGTAAANEERKKQGYPSIELVGWATTPHYDKAAHKLYWAKELKFSDGKENTLNYNIRVLGRRGVLVLNAVAGMTQLSLIEMNTPKVLEMVEFKEGHRYADFNGNTDKIAAYGIAGLVAGTIAAKAGFFKVLWIGLLAAKKFVIVGVIAVAAFLKKLFGRKAAA